MIGQSVKRFDDTRLLTGGGRFSDDFNVEGQAYCGFVRSPYAHAAIRAVETARALQVPGVVAVFTGADLAGAGVGPLASGIGARALEHPNRDGSVMVDLAIPVLPVDRVRFVGDAVAMVVGETPDAVREGCEAVHLDCADLAAVVTSDDALKAGAAQLWDEVPGNLVFDYGAGDEGAVRQGFDDAVHVVCGTFVNNRVAACFTEPRSALASYDACSGQYTLVAGCQSVHGIARNAARCLGVDVGAVRVISPDTGGAFGARSVLYPEYVVLLWAAGKLYRAMKWIGGRGEEFQATTQGRDSLLRGTLGLDGVGRMTALRVDGVAVFGARHAGNGPFSTLRNMERMLASVYDIPALYLNLRGVFTNTTPISSYRGVGRFEVNYVVERLIDQAARTRGFERVALRRTNVIHAQALPKMTPVGSLYDSGDYAGNMEVAMRAGDWAGFAARREAARVRGRLRGIALGNYIEGAGGSGGEYGRIAIGDDGVVSIAAGCVDQGQGHGTVLRQVAGEVLGIDMSTIVVTASDTGLIKDGVGTNASRSMVRAGKAIGDAAAQFIAAGRPVAAQLLQCDGGLLDYDGGVYRVSGSERAVSVFEVARAMDGGLIGEVRHDDETVTFPNGCHLCEVEVDPETGQVTIENFVAVDDVGRAVNPMLVHGQSQGGIAQGIGQALMEEVRYDPESGQLLTGSFMDYPVVRAGDLPRLETISNDCPSPFTAFGVKGAGEGGSTGAPAVVINAILDALAELGVTHIDMPATPERVWRAIRLARSSS